jgi:peroxiredoxin (alkyl hydroperoxide reductase subunit C)
VNFYIKLGYKNKKTPDGLGYIKYLLNYGVLTEGVAIRGLFIIEKRRIIYHSNGKNFSFGQSVDETSEILQAIQYIQANPDIVCPVDWKAGEKL